ncbi:MAG: ATP-binding protein [Verrucomicrobiae bacterium]|nr:ATP-binding protein [Verrucomicrobiae bacterium]
MGSTAHTPVSNSPIDHVALRKVLAGLARGTALSRGNLELVLKNITREAAKALCVARVNIWLISEDRKQLNCIESYDRRAHRHTSGDVLLAREAPSYFESLDILRSIIKIDTENDPRTRELAEFYLKPHGISTMLDAPIYLAGDVVGVVCHEHVGPLREWSSDEISFASSVGDFVSVALETDRRIRVERDNLDLQARLLKAQSLESLGLMSGGIIHDIKNSLTAITLRCECLLSAKVTPDAVRKHAEAIKTVALKSAQHCQDTLSSANVTGGIKKDLCLSKVVEGVMGLARNVVPPEITIDTDIRDPLPPLRADELQMRQIFLNLVYNASDAIGDKPGVITIRTGEMPAPDPKAGRYFPGPASVKGHCAFFEVRDTGHGIPAEKIGSLFEPFFSTKSKGNGLGLAIILNIVKNHRGAICVESSPGHGSCFRVLLPVK